MVFGPIAKSGICAVLALAMTGCPAVLSAEENQKVELKLADVGVSTHSEYGKGVELQIRSDAVLPDGTVEGKFPELSAAICNYYAPRVLPLIAQQAQLTAPDFIGVKLLLGNGMVGKYLFQAYAVEDGSCGAPL
ncbi:hypothetical protein [Salipiger mangrovisoli]|uniref:Lipoprotein n=1 Tax=Salipiger mangrovisoli TaxID=2865933 RepID=A0ABR9X267_9RHOB|nr:hypothetical protein [Salipiger mangrovisoli]MBE9637593.1 hypothetical protein [Salipiger mangrovisoli]